MQHRDSNRLDEGSVEIMFTRHNHSPIVEGVHTMVLS